MQKGCFLSASQHVFPDFPHVPVEGVLHLRRRRLKTLMGHCGISTTEKYLHVFDRQKMDAVNSLGSIGYAMP